MKKESEAIKKLCNPNSKVSSHYYVKNNGEILTLVPDLYQAWHAGKSYWKNYKSLNKYSIGIEITNPGHQHGYKNFSIKQITSIKRLLKYLIRKYKIDKRCILGHSDISPDRKKDPGEKFPWFKLAKNKLCQWHKLDQNKLREFRKVWLLSKKQEKKFLSNLLKIGYVKNPNNDLNTSYLVKAFQRRFRNELINGKIDKECFLISNNLINS
tara:strand:+ start:2422 stop:3054 length:633 start_codon:yes stop_codon:yes gene_type:complete